MTHSRWFEQRAEQVLGYLTQPITFLVIFSTLVIVGVSAIAYGAWGVFFAPETSVSALSDTTDDATINTTMESPPTPEATPEQTTTVDVSGGVVVPGVYALSADSRVVDFISAAGGFSDTADKAALSRTVNLAQRVADGEKIHIPLKGEVSENSDLGSGATGVVGNAGANTTGYVVTGGVPAESVIGVNTASQKELESLPGVGEKRASDIIAGRPYDSLDQLVERKILPASLFEKLEDTLKL